ncbi:Neuralized-like protein 4 [Nymphon striatum]|nr:Neuralized-like protein 4 [Nymphon striatum]
MLVRRVKNEAAGMTVPYTDNDKLKFHKRTGSLIRLSRNNRLAERHRAEDEFNNGVVMTHRPLKNDELFEHLISDVDLIVIIVLLQSEKIAALVHNSDVEYEPMESDNETIDSYESDDVLSEHEDDSVMLSDSWKRIADIFSDCRPNSLPELVRNFSGINPALNCNANNSILENFKKFITNDISVDGLVDKWSGSIEVGITTHNPNTLDFPATMTNMRSGTIMMSGSGILINGKGTRREYGEFNLDDLQVGDRIGMMRKNNGNLHFFINGLNQGVAATGVPTIVYGAIDLYGMTVKVSIVDSSDCSNSSTPVGNMNNMDMHLTNTNMKQVKISAIAIVVFKDYDFYFLDDDNSSNSPLCFHPLCGYHANVINNGHTAHRPNAFEDFNHGVVLTNRTLKKDEKFEIELDMMISKWAGSVEIGLTTHRPLDLKFPSTMTNVRSGTWLMTSNGVMHNGTTVLNEYGQVLDRLKVGSRVGVVRKENGTVHFFVNGVDQGPAATNVPEEVFGVIDLYGQAVQATIVDQSVSSSTMIEATDIRFHHRYGRNAVVINQGSTAYRPSAFAEFNDAIVISDRSLREGEMFEVVIEKMVDRWSGSIECVNSAWISYPCHICTGIKPFICQGVTIIKPDDLEFPNTMTDIDYGTWMLSGSAIMQDGTTIRNGYKCDLDQLTVNSRIGMKRHSDGSLHYYLNGIDQGMACHPVPADIYAVIDLYGQCSQVSILPPSGHLYQVPEMMYSQTMDTSRLSLPLSSAVEVRHKFSETYGRNITLRSNCRVATRMRGYNKGLTFGSLPLETDEIFEISIDSINHQWAGSIIFGVTTLVIGTDKCSSVLPSVATELHNALEADTWLVVGTKVKLNNKTIKENYAPSLERLKVSDRVGLRRCPDGTLRIYINSRDFGIAAYNVPKSVYPLVDVFGFVQSVRLLSRKISIGSPDILPSQMDSVHSALSNIDSLENDLDSVNKESTRFEFHGNRGRNIELLNDKRTAQRIASYNQGLVFFNRPAKRGQLYQIQIDKLNPRWTSSLLIGITANHPEKTSLSVTALSIRKSSWVICSESVYHNGTKIKGRYGPNLNSLQVGHRVGIMVDVNNTLHLYVNGIDQGVAAKHIPNICYILADLYGQCEQLCGDLANIRKIPEFLTWNFQNF